MNTFDRETFRLYAGTPEHVARVADAERLVGEALAGAKKPYVAFSGGKDSTCLLHLVLRRAPDIMVWHWDKGEMLVPEDVELESVEIARRLGAVNVVLESMRGQNRGDIAGSSAGQWQRRFVGHLHGIRDRGYDVCFMGIRAEESKMRAALIREGKDNIRVSGVAQARPLASWTWRDVWAYLVGNDVPYHSHYDLYGPVVGWDRVRFDDFFNREKQERFGSGNVDGLLMPGFKHM
jgi:3'-phosphoadenosine 5'-phosphosulfate sulfotransferase (PAPS reductase)/FAD synthetase